MDFDIIFPNKNEEDFFKIAKELDISKLLLAYYENPTNADKIIELGKSYNIEIEILEIRNTKNINKQKNKCRIMVESGESNRSYFESRRIDFILNVEDCGQREYIHHRNSGLNQILCKLAAQRGLSVVVSFGTLLNASKVKKYSLLGRIKQNKILCEKYKVRYKVASCAKSPYEMRKLSDLNSLYSIL